MSNILTRVEGSVGLTARIGIGSEVVVNDFDTKYPFGTNDSGSVGIYAYTDDNGEKWVRIPKFYSYYETDSEGRITGRKLSQYKVDKNTWFLNPKFKDANGNELPYIEVSAYLCSVVSNTLVAKTGLTPLVGTSCNVTSARAMAKNRSDSNWHYQLLDYWTYQLLQDLVVVEFANSDCTDIVEGYSNGTNRLTNGTTDALGSKSGRCEGEEGKVGTRYRYIENLWGNGRLFIDGIRFDNDVIMISDNAYAASPTYYSAGGSSNWVKPIAVGTVSYLKYNSTTHVAFPYTILTSGTGAYEQQYNGEAKSGSSILYSNGGLYAYHTNDTETQTNAMNAYRLVRIPITTE